MKFASLKAMKNLAWDRRLTFIRAVASASGNNKASPYSLLKNLSFRREGDHNYGHDFA